MKLNASVARREDYRKAKQRQEKSVWESFHCHQESTRTALPKSHWNYVNNILVEGLEQGNHKSFWSYIKSQKQESVGVVSK